MSFDNFITVFRHLQLYLGSMTDREKLLGNCGEIPLGCRTTEGFQLRYNPPKFINRVMGMIIDLMEFHYTWLLAMKNSYSIPHSFGNIM